MGKGELRRQAAGVFLVPCVQQAKADNRKQADGLLEILPYIIAI
ncbi:hypothetical protein REC12_13865 [Desulfosporosinus sp. PR]|nr:hypothetical protein [Desulfosporosinus sp. PR]MDQ7094678.1 hypothetical protein [Desulfosporosinus sp. PR]